MHRHDASTEVLTQAIVRYAIDRVRLDPPPLDGPRTPRRARRDGGLNDHRSSGIGGLEALRVFGDVLAPACISVDHPRFLSFVPAAPTEASILFDLVVGASSVYAGSWLEGGGAVYAENEALRWIADLAGLPAEAGGVFVSGGTAGNLSALIAARWNWRHDADGALDRTRGLIVTSAGAHSSIAQAGRAMDVDVVLVPADDARADARRGAAATARRALGRRSAAPVRDRRHRRHHQRRHHRRPRRRRRRLRRRYGVWFHVDGAYGGAALAAPSVRHRFDGIERADSFIVDPHKWLFAPFDCCALLYRDPRIAQAAHTQQADYLDVLHDDDDLERQRLRPPPRLAVPAVCRSGSASPPTAPTPTGTPSRRRWRSPHAGADVIRAARTASSSLEPELSVVVFRRLGWTRRPVPRVERRAAGRNRTAFVVPTSWRGETVLRYCVVNPLTTVDDLAAIVTSLA